MCKWGLPTTKPLLDGMWPTHWRVGPRSPSAHCIPHGHTLGQSDMGLGAQAGELVFLSAHQQAYADYAQDVHLLGPHRLLSGSNDSCCAPWRGQSCSVCQVPSAEAGGHSTLPLWPQLRLASAHYTQAGVFDALPNLVAPDRADPGALGAVPRTCVLSAGGTHLLAQQELLTANPSAVRQLLHVGHDSHFP